MSVAAGVTHVHTATWPFCPAAPRWGSCVLFMQVVLRVNILNSLAPKKKNSLGFSSWVLDAAQPLYYPSPDRHTHMRTVHFVLQKYICWIFWNYSGFIIIIIHIIFRTTHSDPQIFYCKLLSRTHCLHPNESEIGILWRSDLGTRAMAHIVLKFINQSILLN